MKRDQDRIAADFVKGRIGEEIIKQLFRRMNYEVFPVGVEHTNMSALYECNNWDYLFMQSRRMPDFSAVKEKTHRYIEAKFRYKRQSDPFADLDVYKTVLSTFYFRSKDKQKLVRTNGQFDDILMIWMFLDRPCICKLSSITDAIDSIASAHKWSFNMVEAKLQTAPKINWNSNLEISHELEAHKLPRSDWDEFTTAYPKLLKLIFE